MSATPRRNYFKLIIGGAFLGYGLYRIFTFLTGAEYTSFRIIIAVGFIIIGGFDLLRFFKPKKPKSE